MSLPTREHKWTNMKGLQYNLMLYQPLVRNYVLAQAKKKVMKMTNGLYPAPLKIIAVSIHLHTHTHTHTLSLSLIHTLKQ